MPSGPCGSVGKMARLCFLSKQVVSLELFWQTFLLDSDFVWLFLLQT